MMNVAVAQSRHDDLMREISSPQWRIRAELAFERRLQRASRLAGLRRRLARAFGRHAGATPSEVREVMTIARAR